MGLHGHEDGIGMNDWLNDDGYELLVDGCKISSDDYDVLD